MNFQKMQEVAIKDLEDYSRLKQSGSNDKQGFTYSTRSGTGYILNQFFVERETRYAGHRARLTAKYGLCLSDLYRLKNQALTNYAVSLLMLKTAVK